MSSSSTAIALLFQERAERLKKQEEGLSKSVKIKKALEKVYLKLNKEDCARLERDALHSFSHSTPMDTIEEYAMYLYNQGKYVSFTRFEEMNMPKDVRIRHMFETIRFDVPSSKPLMQELDKILAKIDSVSIEEVESYVNLIKTSRTFTPFEKDEKDGKNDDVIDLTDYDFEYDDEDYL